MSKVGGRKQMGYELYKGRHHPKRLGMSNRDVCIFQSDCEVDDRGTCYYSVDGQRTQCLAVHDPGQYPADCSLCGKYSQRGNSKAWTAKLRDGKQRRPPKGP